MLIDGTGNVSVYNTPSSNNHVANKAYVDNSIPIGGIIMWSGAGVTLPSNWKLCDGSVYSGITTPDLRGRFVLSSGQGGGGLTNRGVGSTGGVETVTLTVDQIPSHNHGGLTTSDNSTNNGSHEHTVTGTTNMLSYDGFMLIYNGAQIDVHTNSHNRSFSIPLSNGKASSTGSAHDHKISSQGGSSSHENMPPFYVLAFIMRIS